MHFSIYRSRDGQFYWEARGGNYETMAVSETYTSKASAEHAIDVVKREAADASVLDMTEGTKYDRTLP